MVLEFSAFEVEFDLDVWVLCIRLFIAG